jgi:hypothetical protein
MEVKKETTKATIKGINGKTSIPAVEKTIKAPRDFCYVS